MPKPTYVTGSEFLTRYDVSRSWGSGTSEVASNLVHFAEVQLDGMLASAFTVPFSDVPQTIKDITMDLAYCKSVLTKDPEKAKLFCPAVMDRIERIKNGMEPLVTDSGTILEPSGASQEIWSSTQNYHPVYSMLDAEDAASSVDSSRLQDEVDERS